MTEENEGWTQEHEDTMADERLCSMCEEWCPSNEVRDLDGTLWCIDCLQENEIPDPEFPSDEAD